MSGLPVSPQDGAGPTVPAGPAARRLHVTGVVQGVGFRPFVHRLAVRHGLGGWVRNESGRVFVHVEGGSEALEAFAADLVALAPPLARIDRLDVEPASPCGEAEFRVLASRAGADGRLPVPPDVATCPACLAELADPADRRAGYPFITCTDCGPRYTVIESMPYDRERTSMRAFRQCDRCLAEYRDPADRRYHSETNSCPACGPRVWLADGAGHETAGGDEAIREAARLLETGGILALRGLGGFHLAVDAGNGAAVGRLRERKGRWEKPLAVMAASRDDAARLGVLGELEAVLLEGRERPIVLLRRLPDAPLCEAISPGLDTVGVMLPYTPLHALLLREAGRPLVMTSGNRSELPIATANEEARRDLGDIADAFLLHDREIVSRYDDSVLRPIGGAPAFLRRARGYAPLPVRLPVPAERPLLAVGPHLKNTFALASGDRAWISQHVGDLENLETLAHWRAALAHFEALFRIAPEVLVRDAHPGYLSTRLAEELAAERGAGPPLVVQHHHAHVAATAAEHGETGSVVGLAFDGTGYGEDGHVWGAETLVADLVSFRRAARLRYAPLPGGDLAARRPWRAALGYLSLAPGEEPAFREALRGVPAEERALAARQAERGVNAPLASSMGRLFDAAAAVLGIRRACAYEGQAAMVLEARAAACLRGADEPDAASGQRLRERAAERRVPELPFPEACEDGLRVWDPLPLLAALGRRRAEGGGVAALAAAFHLAVADRAATTARDVAAEAGLDTVVLGGGTFQNALLVPMVRDALRGWGLRVLVPSALGANDGGVSYGQAAVAAARLATTGG
ncbi:MAG: carbamoyltransferase HypF [Gemmatimonadota bacterium]|nr:carbamoyltransferase HypF [Gemmatimonadota bacterium]